MCTEAWINECSHQWRLKNPYFHNRIGDVVAELHSSGETFQLVASFETSSLYLPANGYGVQQIHVHVSEAPDVLVL